MKLLSLVKRAGLMVSYIILYLMSSLLLQLGSLAGLSDRIVLWSGLAGLVVAFVVIFFLWRVLYERLPLEIRHPAPWWGMAWFAVIFWFICLFIPAETGSNQAIIEHYIQAYPVIAFINVVVTGPILEELILRGFMAKYFFPQMRSTGQILAYLLASSTLFSLLHSPETFPLFLAYFCMGFAFGWLFIAKKDIRYSIALHVVNNLLSFVLVVLFW